MILASPESRIRIIFLFLSISVFSLFLPSESFGAKINDRQLDNAIALNNLPSKTRDSLLSSLNDEKMLRTDSVTLSSEKKGKPSGGSALKFARSSNEINQFVLWALGDKNVSEFKNHMADIGNKNLPLFLRKSYMRFVQRTYTYPIILLLILLILGLIINITVVLLVLYYTNSNKNHKERYIHIYRNSYEDVLRSYLFGEIEWELALLKLKKLKKTLNRKILTEVLLTFKENLRGEMDSQIPQIFIKLGLERDSFRLCKSVFYFRRIEGLKALTNLDPENAKKIIPNYLNDSHFLVRTEAQIAYVRLYPENPFDFLKSLISPFPRWTQLSSFYIFRLYKVPIPVFADYLDSEIPTIRNFSLRMIVFFQQLENASAIYKMLDSPLEMTRFLSIRAINDLRLYEGKEMIKEIYQSETGNNKIEIIKALKNIGGKDDFDFLESIIRTESISLKTEACRSLYYVDNEGPERLNKLNQDTDLNIDQYLAHVTDPRN